MSPAQLLKGYTLRDNLPRYETPQVPERNLIAERKTAKHYDDIKLLRNSNTEFQPNQPVAIQHATTKEWLIKGKIIQEIAPRLYEVQCRNGNIVRRNQRFIRKTYVHLSTPVNKTGAEQPDQESRDEDSDSDETIPYKEPEEELPPQPKRRIKKKIPLDYDDL